MTINLRKITQGERGTLTFTWEFPENLTSPASISGAVITATMTDEDGVTTAVSGTLTGTAATTCTWALSAGDSGTAGTFTVLFKAVAGGVTTYTLQATLEVITNPAVTGAQNDPLVSISVADAAWLTAAAARVSDGDDVATRDNDGTAGNLTVLDASGNAVDGGYVASQDGIANSVVQRIADGTIYNLISAPASAAVIGSNYQGIGITADSNSGTGLVAKSTSGAYAIEAQDGSLSVQVSGIRRVDGVLEFVGVNAATNRAAQRTELGLGTAALAATGDFDAAGAAAAAQAAAVQRANHTGTQLLSTISDVGTMAAQATTSYYAKTDFSATPTAAEPLKADGSGGMSPKTIDLRGATVADFTALFPSKSATAYGIQTQSSAATGGLSANGFTNATATALPVIFTAYHGSTSPTVPAIIFRGAKHNGTTSAVALAFAESIFQIRNWTSNVMTVLGSGAVGLRTDTPAAQLHIVPNGAAALGLIIQMPTSATGNSFEVRDVSGNTLGQIGPAGNIAFGQQSTASHEISGKLKSSTTANTQAARIAWAWTVATHASRTATLTLYASDYGGERTGLQIGANGTAATVGFYGVTPTARQLLATGTGASVDDVIGALQTLGLLRQS